MHARPGGEHGAQERVHVGVGWQVDDQAVGILALARARRQFGRPAKIMATRSQVISTSGRMWVE